MAAHRRAARRVGLRRRRHQRLVRHPQRGRVAARRARPRDARSAARARRPPAGAPSTPATVRERELDPAVGPRCWRSASGPAPATTGTDEVTADDPDDPRRHPARRGPGDGAAEERRRRCCRWPPTAQRVALIGPYARFGRPQGGGSARVRPDHGRGPFDALAGARLRRHVRAGRLDRQVPADGARRLHRRRSPTRRVPRPRPTPAGWRGTGTSRRPTGIDARRVRRRHRRHVRARRDRASGSSACGPSAR